MSAANRTEWEDALVLGASYFTCSVAQLGTRKRGERMQWLVTPCDSLLSATRAVDAHIASGGRALVYAVDATGASAPLARADWPRYLKLRGEA